MLATPRDGPALLQMLDSLTNGNPEAELPLSALNAVSPHPVAPQRNDMLRERHAHTNISSGITFPPSSSPGCLHETQLLSFRFRDLLACHVA